MYYVVACKKPSKTLNLIQVRLNLCTCYLLYVNCFNRGTCFSLTIISFSLRLPYARLLPFNSDHLGSRFNCLYTHKDVNVSPY